MKFLLRETKQRLAFSNSTLEDLRECMQRENLSQDAREYLREQINKTNKNINYYLKLVNQLEDIQKKESE